MIRKLASITAVATLYALPAFAGYMGEVGGDNYYSGIITVSGGPAWYNNDQRRTISLFQLGSTTPVVNRFMEDPKTRVLGTGEIFFGLSSPLCTQLSGQLGLAVAYAGSGTRSGVVIQQTGLSFNTFDYSFKESNARVSVKGKLVGELGYAVNPYITASAGAGFNRAYNYLPSGPTLGLLPFPIFKDNTELAFTYTTGIGVQTAIDPHWQVGLGYEFADWGKSSLNFPPPGQLLSKTYHVTTFYTHELQLSLTYVV